MFTPFSSLWFKPHETLKSANTSVALYDTFLSKHLFKESHNEIKQHFHVDRVAPENTGKA